MEQKQNSEAVTSLEAAVCSTVFRSKDLEDNFRILSMQDNKGKVFSAKGEFGELADGTRLILRGRWGKPFRGKDTFECDFFERILPTTECGMKEYLASGIVQGCGPALAARIVGHFGEKTFEVLDNEPDRLTEVNGIGEKKKERIKEGWVKQKAAQSVGQYLYQIGVPIRYTGRVIRELGENAADIIKENPYRLCDVEGIGFRTADGVALRNGIEKESPFRLSYGVSYCIDESCAYSHTYIPFSDLVSESCRLLGAGKDPVRSAVLRLSEEGKIVIEDEAVYKKSLYKAENNVAETLLLLKDEEPFPCSAITKEDLEEASGVTYDETQEEAIRAAVEESVLVITGGPGTGKSTILRGLCEQFSRGGLTVRMAAPTGRAAKKMSEVTETEAATIHRMLLSAESSGDDPDLDADVVIVDESSMIDISLMSWLMSCIKPGMRFVMIGDVDQLPSVGPGKVLSDVIESGVFRVIRLQKIFRQDDGSLIVENAKKINEGDAGLVFNKRNGGFYFVRTKNDEETEDRILELVSETIPKKLGFREDDIQVLTPIRKAGVPAGASVLNTRLQEVLNPAPDGAPIVAGLRAGDRVMNMKNNYEKGFFNGDAGRILSIDQEDKKVVVGFDGFDIDFDFDEMDDLALCYATTVHKAQGSEYPVIVMPMTMAHYYMLQRRLLYTAVTRAKKAVFLVGDPEALIHAIRNDRRDVRRGRLLERLRDRSISGSPKTDKKETKKVDRASLLKYIRFADESRSEEFFSLLRKNSVWPCNIDTDGTVYVFGQAAFDKAAAYLDQHGIGWECVEKK